MNFFEHQDRAQSRTKLLVFLFIIGFICLMGTINLCVYFLAKFQIPLLLDSHESTLHIWTSLITLILVGGGTAFRTRTLQQQGGISIALDLGGVPIDMATKDPKEKQLRNIVEEMAIASGVPVPEIFVLDEAGINAFAAGFTTDDAIVAVTRGCLNELNRDELQGVIAHEFSHIFHGDMRLNMRMTGILYGIFILSSVGRILMRSTGSTRGRRQGGTPLPLLGIAIYLVGSMGLFFGRAIQASVSRQREFLADASAVQYTRNPQGIAGALKKIAEHSLGSRVENPAAQDLGHFFFANASRWGFSGIFRTHPPIQERIKAIDPKQAYLLEKKQRAEIKEAYKPAPIIDPASLIIAQSMLSHTSDYLLQACRDPFSVRAVVLALLSAKDPSIYTHQLKMLDEARESNLRPIIQRVRLEMEKLGLSYRLPLLDLCIPATRQLSRTQKQGFMKTIEDFVMADRRIELFEFCLLKILSNHLQSRRFARRPSVGRQEAIDASSLILSSIIKAGYGEIADQERVFKQITEEFGFKTLKLQIEAELRMKELDRAIETLRFLKTQDKEKFVKACQSAVTADKVILPLEYELFRAVSESIAVPAAPQKLAS
ncbi:MAG: hypothetical protein COV44_07800 [Deltaproteobacteria bacterium CG11_big_fil_rev_8_21_14_0_20_45_16]|nr:MAG: hypothetical protein COV44_07800 [Deltaproteobacteria bacterium CG11_big_fil_rev_8_21_14_0_20_45_16]